MRFVRPRVPASLQLVALIALLSVLSFGTRVAVAAEFTVGASASGQTATKNVQQGGDTRTGSSPVWAGANVNVQDSAAGVLQNAEGVGYASASYGHLVFVSRAATSQTSVSGAQPGLHAESYASASMTDSFIISCATCVTGTRGTMNFRVVLEGDVGLSDPAFGTGGQPDPGPLRTRSYYWSSNLSMRAEGVAMEFPGPGTLSLYAYDYLAMVEDRVVAGGSRGGMGIYDYQLEFEFGTPIHMNWQATTDASADLRPEGSAVGFLSAMGHAAFSNSFYWDGISAVTDADGNLVNGFTALNSVGVDYAQSFANAAVVPEPGTWALMAAGIAALGLIARHRHTRRSGPTRRLAATVAVVGAGLGLAGASVAQESSSPSFGVTASYSLEAAGTSSRTGQGGGATALGEARRFDAAIGFSDSALSSDASVAGWGAAQYGRLQAHAQGSTSLETQTGGRNSYAQLTVTSSMTDSFVIQCGTCAPGTTGRMYFQFGGDVAMTRTGGLGQPMAQGGFMADTAWWSSTVLTAAGVPDPPPQPGGWIDPNPGFYWRNFLRNETLHNDVAGIESSDRSSAVDFNPWIEFVFGEPIRLDMSLSASVLGAAYIGDSNAPFSGYGRMETAIRSLYWDGIPLLVDAQGNIVSDFTALNAAGLDYARSFATAAAVVPESGTWALMVAGLVVLGLIARRGHPRHIGATSPIRPATRFAALLAACGGLTGLGVGSPAHAQSPPPFEVDYDYQLVAPGATSKMEQRLAFTTAGEVRRFNDAIGFSDASLFSDARIEGWGAARYGHLQAFAKGSTALTAQAPDQSTYVFGGITATVIDSFIIQCGTCAAGTVGSMNFRVFFDAATAREGGLGQPPTSTGGYLADTDWWTGFGITAQGVPNPSPPDVPGPPNPGQLGFQYYRLETLHNDIPGIEESPRVSAGLQELSIQFVFGEPIRLDMSLSARVLGGVYTGENSTSFSGHGAMETDTTRSMYWDGITSVFDAQGNVVNGFTALNATGIDYARSFATAAVVPEPGAWALMAGGLMMVAMFVRRRSRGTRTATGTVMWTKRIALALCAALLPGLAPAATELSAQASSRAIGNTLVDQHLDGFSSQVSTASTSAGLFESGDGFAVSGSARSRSQVYVGGMQMSVTAGVLTTTLGAPAQMYTDAAASGRVLDSFVVDCATCVAGTRGTMTLLIQVDPEVTWTGGLQPGGAGPVAYGGYSNWTHSLQTRADGIDDGTGAPLVSTLYSYAGTKSYNGTVTETSMGPPAGLQSLTLDFIFGQAVHIDWSMQIGFSNASGQLNPHSDTSWSGITMKLGPNDLSWAGITSVFDAGGQGVSGYTALNGDGIDYAQAMVVAVVPEPGTWLLMIAGSALLALLSRGRRDRGSVPATHRAPSARPASRRRFPRRLLLLALAWPAMAGAAETFVSTSTHVHGPVSDEQDASIKPPWLGPVSSQLSVSDAGPRYAATGQVRTWGQARPGGFEMSAAASATAAANNESAWIYAEGNLTGSTVDSFIVTCPTCVTGTRGSLTLQLQVGADAVTWSGGATPLSYMPIYDGSAGWESHLQIAADGVRDESGQRIDRQLKTNINYEFVNGDPFTFVQGTPPGLQSLTLDFIFGQPVGFVWNVSMNVYAVTGREELHTADTWVSIALSMGPDDTYWRGISSVLDSSGARVTGYRALNADGVDFARSFANAAVVPEPGTWALMVLGLLAMGVLAGARAARSQGLPALRR